MTSDWDSNSWVNIANGDAKPKQSTKTLGYTIGGPVGKPGGNNKLFFFYSHEYRPVTAAINNGNPIRIRVPTAAEGERTAVVAGGKRQIRHTNRGRLHGQRRMGEGIEGAQHQIGRVRALQRP